MGLTLLLAGCADPPDWKLYDPNPPLVQEPLSTKTVAVLPFTDERWRHAGAMDQFGPRGFVYRDGRFHGRAWGIGATVDRGLRRVYARWLAKELDASRLFSEVRYLAWHELLAQDPPPDLVVTGSIRRCDIERDDLLGSPWFWILPPLAPTWMFFPIPMGQNIHRIELEVRAMEFGDVRAPRWAEVFEFREEDWFGSLWLGTPDTEYFARKHNEDARAIYAQVTRQLSAALKPEGALHDTPR